MIYKYTKNINTQQFIDELNTVHFCMPEYMETVGDSVKLYYTEEITEEQLTSLSTIIDNHIAVENYITLANQSQINQLINYLNSVNPTVANTARAVMITNLAPRLPSDLLVTINAAIYTKLNG